MMMGLGRQYVPGSVLPTLNHPPLPAFMRLKRLAGRGRPGPFDPTGRILMNLCLRCNWES